jgi:hypothetical protein
MRPDPDQGERFDHTFVLYCDARRVGRLEWRAALRETAGWYLRRDGGRPVRLDVDASIAELARDQRSERHEWELNAELAAILSTPIALDAADQALYQRPLRQTGRFRRVRAAARFELYVSGVDATTLSLAVPELPLESVADVAVLSGQLLPGAFQTILRRVALLGGTVVALRRDDDDGS